MQLGDVLFDVWLSVTTFLVGTPVFWFIGIEADRHHHLKAKDKNTRNEHPSTEK